MHEHDVLPSRQVEYAGLAGLDEWTLYRRREGVFLLLAGLFVGTLAMLNILGVTRFVKLFEIDFDPSKPGATAFAVAVGVLPYPVTFLCTDFISELYGRRRATLLVWIGFILNLWVVLILWLGGALPGFEAIDPETNRPALDAAGRLPVFYEVRTLAFGAVGASMFAYLVAQLVDVHLFHYWKRRTKGRHLWLRNNGSTLVSQLVDTAAVILITHFFARGLPIDRDSDLWPQLLAFMATGYIFKVAAAMIDTIPFYLGARHMARYLRLPPPAGAPHPPAGAAVEAGVG
jgi:uncharacterized integral membrane protein (TIGR00697 family)